MDNAEERSRYFYSKASPVTIIAYIYSIIFAVACFLPFIMMFSASITDENYIAQNGYGVLPHQITFNAYKFIIGSNTSLWRAYGVTVFVTVTGTVISLLITSALAYSLSRKELRLGKAINIFVIITMLFQVALVPWYIIISKYYQLYNNIWVLILPYAVNAWNMFVLKSFFTTIPDAIIESARIDGCNEAYLLFRIILPLSKPGLATIGLFYAIQYWNDWYLSLMFISKQNFWPLQYLLRMIMSSIQYVSSGGVAAAHVAGRIPSESAKMAITIIALGPILLVYPYIQSYFVKGITLGAVKG